MTHVALRLLRVARTCGVASILALPAFAGPAPIPARTIDVVFIPDVATAPIVVVTAQSGAGKRTLAWAVMGKGTGVLVDDEARKDLFSLPSAPRGASLSDKDGALSITIDDAGTWEESVRALPAPKGIPALPVPGPNSLRLAIDPSADPNASPAVVYGANVRVVGRAVVRRDQPLLRAVVVAGKDVYAAEATAVDVVSACDRTVPSMASVIADASRSGAQQNDASFKLFASGPAVCAGPIAIVPVTGSKLDAKKDVPAAGVVVARAAKATATAAGPPSVP